MAFGPPTLLPWHSAPAGADGKWHTVARPPKSALWRVNNRGGHWEGHLKSSRGCLGGFDVFPMVTLRLLRFLPRERDRWAGCGDARWTPDCTMTRRVSISWRVETNINDYSFPHTRGSAGFLRHCCNVIFCKNSTQTTFHFSVFVISAVQHVFFFFCLVCVFACLRVNPFRNIFIYYFTACSHCPTSPSPLWGGLRVFSQMLLTWLFVSTPPSHCSAKTPPQWSSSQRKLLAHRSSPPCQLLRMPQWSTCPSGQKVLSLKQVAYPPFPILAKFFILFSRRFGKYK